MIDTHRMDLVRGTPSGIVRRLLSGEKIDLVSAETGISETELHSWMAVFVDAGARALDRYAHQVWKHARLPRQTQPRSFQAITDADGEDEHLSIEEHQHQLWIELGLADE